MRWSGARLAVLWIVVACLCGSLALERTPQVFGAAGPADLVLLHGKVVTVDSQSRLVQAVAVLQGRVAALGTDAQIQPYVGATTRVIDLHGRTVIPGLIDSHIHAIRQGLTWDDEVHWQTVTSLRQGLQMLRDRAARTPPGTWIVVGGGWHESQFTEQRRPTPEEIEAIYTDHPVFVQYLNDDALLNKAAMKAMGITAGTSLPGGEVMKDPSGQPTGVVSGTGAVGAVYFKIPRPPLDGQIASTRHWFSELNRLGLTDLGDAAGGGLFWRETTGP